MTTRDTAGSREGHSLLEVLIALTILSVGLLGLALFQVTAIKGNASANDTMIATAYAQEQLEVLRGTPFANVATSGGISGGLPDYPNLTAITNPAQVYISKKGVTFYRVWNVTNNSPVLRTVTVWACWRDAKGVWHTAQLATQRGNVQ